MLRSAAGVSVRARAAAVGAGDTGAGAAAAHTGRPRGRDGHLPQVGMSGVTTDCRARAPDDLCGGGFGLSRGGGAALNGMWRGAALSE